MHLQILVDVLRDQGIGVERDRRDQRVEVDVLEGKRRTSSVPVTDIIQSYFGLMVFMDIDALDILLDEGPRTLHRLSPFVKALTER